MDIAAVRSSRYKVSGPSRRINRTRGGAPRRDAPARSHTTAARLGVEPWATTRRYVPIGRKTLWEKLGDDRELVGVKVTLLTTLLIVTAVLDWVG